jgi:AcrR family transcriptional regulator
MPATRLSRADWIDAALDVLLREGPNGVAVQPLSRRLKATKGSFYWHFSSRDDVLRAALDRWETVAADDVIAAVESRSGEPAARATLLIATLTARSQEHPGELLLLAATDHPDVAAAVQGVTQRRIDYLARLLRGSGFTPAVAARRATVGYAAYLGHAQLTQAVPGVLPATAHGRRGLMAELNGVLLTKG